MRNLLQLLYIGCCFYSCKNADRNQQQNTDEVKQHLLSLENKWLQYEFALDTASISPLLDSTFISISATGTSNKQMELEGIYKNISTMRADSIFIDSFKLEGPFIVNQFDNTAIVVFICHTYKTAKGKHEEKRTKFYDVWRNVNEQWKAVSSQGTVVEEIK